MFSKRRPIIAITAASAALMLTLAGCASGSPAANDTTAAPTTVDIEDNHGTHTISVPPKNVVVTDNRLFQTLADWNISLAAAPVDLIPSGLSYKTDASIVNLGSHNEPDLEAVVAVEPGLIINGQRFASHYEDLKKLAPEASIIELDPRDGESFDEELRRQVRTLGQVFDRQEDANKLIADFDASIERVKAAYKKDDKVMAVITSGGEINYAAPSTGRTLGPVFDILGLTPAISADGSSDHQGDDISVEAIAASNPNWILVMDRDAGVSGNAGESYSPANELIAKSEALKNVKAVQEDQIIYMPQVTYLNEGIQTYTTFFNSFADALEGK